MLLAVGLLTGIMTVVAHDHYQEDVSWADYTLDRAVRVQRQAEFADPASKVNLQNEAQGWIWSSEDSLDDAEDWQLGRLLLGAASASTLTAGAAVLLIGRRRTVAPGASSVR
ncbi:hypothetical protein ACWGI0_35375 [Streptomyces sp. NPDC054802]